jgi:hypothetical protein
MSVGFIDPPDIFDIPDIVAISTPLAVKHPTYASVAMAGRVSVGTIIDFIIKTPIKLNHVNHKRSKCRYCDKEAICKTCHHIIKCREESNCMACGGLYGRPIKGPISSGCLIVDLTNVNPFVWLVMEMDAKGSLINKFNEPGGKFEPDKDFTPIDTAVREVWEETAFALWLNTSDPYVDLENDGNVYRCYIAIHTLMSLKYMPTLNSSEHPTMKMSLTDFLNVCDNNSPASKYKILHHRIRFLLTRKVKNIPGCNLTLGEYLKKLNEFKTIKQSI